MIAMDGEGGGLYMEVVIPDRRESDGVGFIGRDNAAKTIGFHSFYVGAASGGM